MCSFAPQDTLALVEPATSSILVMKRLIGRYLVADETVHHLNGVKHDNRPENLELWVRPQPSGIRVSDAIEWAREIPRRYGGKADTSNNLHDQS